MSLMQTTSSEPIPIPDRNPPPPPPTAPVMNDHNYHQILNNNQRLELGAHEPFLRNEFTQLQKIEAVLLLLTETNEIVKKVAQRMDYLILKDEQEELRNIQQ